MNVNQKIEQALSEIVGGNIWPLSCPLENTPGEFIVYLPTEEHPEDFGDDRDLAWVHEMEVNWYKKGETKKPVSYIKTRKKIRAALKKAGFCVQSIVPLYEKDTGYTSLVFTCSDIEEEPYGQV